MPLLLLTGYPNSGKTTRAHQLVNYLQNRISTSSNPAHSRLSVVLVSDHTLGLPRSVYNTAAAEKEARAAEFAAIKRALGKDVLVVADGMHGIKGWRYQAWCEARSEGGGGCVIHIGTPIVTCRSLNNKALADKDSDRGYESELFENLIQRYEEPNGMARWDSPLFTVPFEDAEMPLDTIWDAVVEGKAGRPKPGQATVMAPASEPDYLYELDRTTQEVVNALLEWGRDHPGEGGGQVKIEDSTVEMPATPLSLPQLQRLRRQYIALNRQHRLAKTRIKESFIGFLNDNFA